MDIPTGFVETEAHGFYIITRPVYYKLALSVAERDPETILSSSPARSGDGHHGPSAAAQRPGPMQGRGSFVELPGEGGETLILKKRRRGGLYGRLRGDLHRDDYQAVSELFVTETAWKKGVPVALTAFAMSAPAGRGRLAAYRRGYCASIRLDGARSLMDWLSSPTPERERRAVLEAAAQAIHRAHDRGLSHGDLNLGNILVVKSARAEYGGWLIDLDHSRLGGSLRFGPRVQNLVRLYRSAEKWMPATTQAERSRRRREVVFFLRTYTGRERGQVRRYLSAAARHRGSLFLHRLGWKASGGRREGIKRSTAPAGR